ncbi:hypothetical protein YPPY66_3167, partial [Yersinia pestis PY-66]
MFIQVNVSSIWYWLEITLADILLIPASF